MGKPPEERESFGPQWDYVTSTSPRNVVLCGRQAGKTSGVRLAARMALSRGLKLLYVTLIRRNCRALFWSPLKSELAAAEWEMDTNEIDLVAKAPNGGLVMAISADDVRDIHKARGYQWDWAIIDEAQAPHDDVLEPLVDEALIPTLFKTGGRLDMLGTPPDALTGYFVRAVESGTWRRLGWSVFDNPHIPKANVEAAYEARGIGPGHPIWEREVMGKLMANPDAIVYPYDQQRNGCTPDELPGPDCDRDVWRFGMGLDLGFRDHSAIAVVAWRRDDHERRLYLVHEWEQAELKMSALEAAVTQAHVTWRPGYVVYDHAGHMTQGFAAELESRFGAPLEKKPLDLIVSTQLLSDDFRSGRMKAPATSMVARDAGLVIWSEKAGKMVPNAKGYHSDVLDALRYAHWGARHWQARAPKAASTDPHELLKTAVLAQADQWRGLKRNPWAR